MDKIEKMINVFKTQTIKSAIEGLVVEHNDIITNAVKAYLDNLSQDEIANIKGLSKKHIAEVTFDNACKLFRINK